MTSKQAHIETTLKQLISTTPALQAPLERILDSLYYSAPELMDNMWLRIQDVLIQETRNTPPWTNEAHEIWKAACQNYPYKPQEPQEPR